MFETCQNFTMKNKKGFYYKLLWLLNNLDHVHNCVGPFLLVKPAGKDCDHRTYELRQCVNKQKAQQNSYILYIYIYIYIKLDNRIYLYIFMYSKCKFNVDLY